MVVETYKDILNDELCSGGISPVIPAPKLDQVVGDLHPGAHVAAIVLAQATKTMHPVSD